MIGLSTFAGCKSHPAKPQYQQLINCGGCCNLCNCGFCSRFECVAGLFAALFCCGCWKHQDDHNNTQRGTRAVYECARVFRTQWDDGVRVQIQPQTDDLALMNDPGVIWGKDLKGYRKWFEGENRESRNKRQRVKRCGYQTYIFSLPFPNVFSICFSHTNTKVKVNLWPLSSLQLHSVPLSPAARWTLLYLSTHSHTLPL